MKEALSELSETAAVFGGGLEFRQPRHPGLNDGLIIPGSWFPLGTPLEAVRSVAAERAPLRGSLRVAVVLVDFTDRPMGAAHGRKHFEDLFFSRGVLPGGSVREYFAEVSNGLVDIVGQVVGPYRMPRTLAEYANGRSGMSTDEPNARTMARHAAEAANRDVDFAPYDNDGNGFVDAFVVVHAGAGAEQTGSGGDIWSHKWVLANGEYNADGTRIYAYLTVPEDARIGVCCHELGHLLFGWPDLYDTDSSSEGLGNWCLMAGGSWNGNGDCPAHPSAWCKAQQGWVRVVNQTANGSLSVGSVGTSNTVYRLWKDGAPGREYFLVENRQRQRYDRLLPGDGLLVYHVDDAVSGNADERHPKVALLQADGNTDLERAVNRGDAGDPFPGTRGNTSLTGTTNPHTRSYGNLPTGVTLTRISPSGPVMTAGVTVRAATPVLPPRRRPRRFFAPAEGAGAYGPRPQGRRAHLLHELPAEGHAYGDRDATAGGDPADAEWRESVEERLAALEAARAPEADTGGTIPMRIVASAETNGEGGPDQY
ncbi:MAG: M6 family metalloprotease domain-containing protein [Gemmatimonadota bacterium]